MLTQEMPGFAAYTLKTLRSLLKVHVIQGRDYKRGKENVEKSLGREPGLCSDSAANSLWDLAERHLPYLNLCFPIC